MLFLRQKRVGPQAVLAYLIGDTEAGRAVAIDPAAQAGWLVEEATRQGMEIETIINTHGHADHTCGNAALKELTGAELVLGLGDEKFLSGGWAEMSRAGGFSPSPPPDRLVRDGDVISCGSLKLQVIATPGHSPGGICLYLPGHLFSGDTLLVGRAGRADIPGGSWTELADSMKRIMALPPETILWPGHRMGREKSSTLAREAAGNPFLEYLT
jgi:hydroxyacylglutathione hydrolase